MGFTLGQFSEVLKIRDAAGRPYVLIGGQAVNYWAERYFEREPQLQSLRPFTSADIDFQGTADDVVPFAHGQALFAAATAPKRAVWIEGARHNDIFERAGDRILRELVAFDAGLPAGKP